jgi:hypothetical protein
MALQDNLFVRLVSAAALTRMTVSADLLLSAAQLYTAIEHAVEHARARCPSHHSELKRYTTSVGYVGCGVVGR